MRQTDVQSVPSVKDARLQMRAHNQAGLGAEADRAGGSLRFLSRAAVAFQIVWCARAPSFGAAFSVPSLSYSQRGLSPKPLAPCRPRYNFQIRERSGNGDDGGDDIVPSDDREEGDNFFKQIQRWLVSDEGREDARIYTTSLTFALLMRFFIIEPRFIPSESMVPTFQVGDQLAVEKVTKLIRPQERNEVVVFTPPQAFRDFLDNPDSKRAKEALIKRIVATEVSIF
uniref:Peptidase S26 domain-containing protein n=1 Tax=Corethron hystrix TaxID=216773 RepID=A0A7S1FRP2_9STRA|mmetsp:Transcript_26149/g.60111  ORF Transcript_26149/g.60111 Transcript_26149/m.60111 type:complete len:227 (+) Transcript_26149:100-780(+)